MSWALKIVADLALRPACGYKPDQGPATEPTALAALALIGHERPQEIAPALDYLRRTQQADGSVPVREDYDGPGWTTSLAVLAWHAANHPEDRPRIAKAVAWIERTHSKTQARHPDTGHDTMLDGWPWAEGTHAWLEPTAFHLLALKTAGYGARPRAREAGLLLLDRVLPSGGCNYGNTFVLGQVLLAHEQPTGIALCALAGEQDPSGRVERSLGYLRRTLGPDSAACSLAWGLMGLAAHGVRLPEAEAWLERAAARVEWHDGSPHKRALLALAALGPRSPFVQKTS